MKNIVLILVIFILNSCIPLSITPNIKDYKITKARKFKRKLPKKNGFIFEDPKEAGEFYQFIDAKYNLDKQLLERYISFNIKDNNYVLSFFEVEKTTKTINLAPIMIDAKLENNGYGTLLEDSYTYRKGTWFIAILITNENNEDCLDANFKNQLEVITYLKALKNEYLMTHNYTELLFKK